MMESCLAGRPERVGPVEVDDIKKDLLGEFSALPPQEKGSSQSENLQVYLRVRPFTTAENDNAESQGCVSIEGPDTVVLRAPRISQSNRQCEKSLPQTAQRFSFTQVFGPEASQRTVFKGSVCGLVQNVLEGGNCLVFTYGVTNAGKTFTFLGPEHDSGLLPRSLSVIFNSIKDRLYNRMDLKPQRCREVSRLTPDQQAAESSSKKNLLRLLKENDRSGTSGRSTFLEGSSLSSDSSLNSVSEADSFCLDVNSNVRFSVWVSFCEIYNDNIHDLLEQVPSVHHKRTVLRLSQDVKGNSFIKGNRHASCCFESQSQLTVCGCVSDLRWVQVNSSEEAYRVMKIGKKNQSFSSTRLNQLSSRSHSIFSVRILRVDDVGVPRVLGISELALCDLAGSERCSRTHNTGERLKEAGNINSSLLTLGKCISAMRLNQNAKIQHRVPFRESKLTHFLQFFFCGAGQVSMVVNINQNASCFDETLNVLKFSALAQKLVVLNSRPILDDASQSSAMDLSVIIDQADQHRNVSGRVRKSSMVAWETTLEDLLEDEDEDEEQDSVMDGTVLEAGAEEDQEEDTTMEEEDKSEREEALRLVLEARIREEVSAEFMELFNKMEKDYSDRLEREREILEKRADKRVEILQNLVSKTFDLSTGNKEEQAALLDEVISSMTDDLEKIRQDAQSVHRCLTTDAVTAETLYLEKQQTHNQLCEAQKNLAHQQQRISELLEICQQKDDAINKMQAAMDGRAADATRDSALAASIRSQGCRSGGEGEGSRKRQQCAPQEDVETGQLAKKRVVFEEEISRLHEEIDRKEKTNQQLMERIRALEEKLRKQEEEQVLLEQRVQQLAVVENEALFCGVPHIELDQCLNCDSVLSSLEAEQRETSRLAKENKALLNGMFQLQTEVTSLQKKLREQTDRSDNLSEQLSTVKTHLQDLEDQSEKTINSLKQELKEREVQSSSSSAFHATMEEMKKERQATLQRWAQKSQQVQDLQTEQSRLQETLTQSETRCSLLSRSNEDFFQQLQSLRAEKQKCEKEKLELHQALMENENNLEESRRQMEALRGELECLKEDLRGREEKENRVGKTVVEELKEEIQRLEARRKQQNREMEDAERLTENEANTQNRKLEEKVLVSPLKSNMTSRKKTFKTTGRKRKSWEVEDLVFNENKRNRVRAVRNKQSSSAVKENQGGASKKIQELIHGSSSILGSKATNIGSAGGQLVEEETVSLATKPRRGRKNLFRMDASSLMLESPQMASGAPEEKESDHLTIRRQLRSKTCKK
ncbi:kinesin-like protein KIF20A isoform X2 [Betta splendens]|uniref:Kinesin-like protein KIF20A isoform X2 n=1 Tax=Betta splendens TaxID=158456 RepID=A0A9W2XEU9_BETSP|nr:kinesin-like protein KIF20A isoform X2 [Betta splendens]